MTEKFCPLNLTPEEIVDYTREWQGERFADLIASLELQSRQTA